MAPERRREGCQEAPRWRVRGDGNKHFGAGPGPARRVSGHARLQGPRNPYQVASQGRSRSSRPQCPEGVVG